MSARDLAGLLLVVLGVALVVLVKAELDLRDVRQDLASVSERLEALEANDDDQDERILSCQEDLVRAGLVPSLESLLEGQASRALERRELVSLGLEELLELEVEPEPR